MRLKTVLTQGFCLMVSLPRNCPELARAAAQAGAQCLKVHINCHHFASDTRFGSFSQELPVLKEIRDATDLPLGIVTGEQVQPGAPELDQLSQFGFDFWDLFAGYTPATHLDLQMGKMVAVDSHWTPDLVDKLAFFGVDVIESSVIPRDHYRTGLNLVDLCTYARLAESSKMPILIPTQKAIQPREVGYLRQAGAAGITIGAVVTGLELPRLADTTAAFRQAIDDLD